MVYRGGCDVERTEGQPFTYDGEIGVTPDLGSRRLRSRRIEAGPLSQWLANGLIEADLPMVCVERRHMKALLEAQQINKSDRNDARGIAQMMACSKGPAALVQRQLLLQRGAVFGYRTGRG